MLKIYRRQMETLEEAARARFVERMAAHLTRYLPAEAAALGGAELRALIRRGIADAAGQGITTQRETCKYLTLSLAFGPDFSGAPWAASILGDPAILSPFERTARLYAAAIDVAAREEAS